MKVLIINSVCGTGSTGRICTDLADYLIKNNHDVRIAFGRGDANNIEKKLTYRIGSRIDNAVHGLVSRVFDASGFSSFFSTYRFIKWVKAYAPDVINLHNLHGYYLNIRIFFKYLKKSGIRIVWTLHDSWAFSGHSGTCDKVQCDRWEVGCGNCPLKAQYPVSLFDFSKRNWRIKKETFTGVNDLTIISPSEWLSSLIRRSFLKNYKLLTIPNGIDLTVFRNVTNEVKRNYGIEGKYLIIGVSNVWHKYKGLYDFIELSKLLDNRFIVMLVGLNEKQIKELPNSILGIQRTNSINELVEIYSACDYFVNLTYCDTFPTVNLEALACNARVITYDTGGSPEAVKKCGGDVVPRGNIKAVRDLIVNGVQIVDSYGNGYQRVMAEEYFGKDTMFKEYLTAFR